MMLDRRFACDASAGDDCVIPIYVSRRLKEDDTTADIPVVMLTARTGEEDQMRGWQEGILEYVSKPFNPLSLVEWAKRAMEPREPGEESERRRRILEQLRLIQDLRDR